ncbi:hypothetical protein M1116_01495 [Patescibacteria group bacterium]|nr:hypothetical protein [Patescibacteria group bacterium]
MENTTSDQKFILIGVGIIFSLVFIIILVFASKKDQSSSPQANTYLQLDAASAKPVSVAKGRAFQDDVCNVAFGMPSNWVQITRKLPLPQVPLSQAVFDDGSKKSIFSYICYNDKYTFNQFIGDSTDLRSEPFKVGSLEFNRAGNFVYFNKNNKLIILQMFFTKNDINPQPGYEDILQAILTSVK